MSLFPAYSTANQAEKDQNDQENKEEWLKQSSFKININETASESTKNESTIKAKQKKEKKERTKRKKKKEKHKTRKRHSSSSDDSKQTDELYEVDRRGHREYLTVQTISRPAVPKYHHTNRGIGDVFVRTDKKRKPKRYFMQNLTASELDTKTVADECPTTKAEEELSAKTANYNRLLADDPQNVDAWLEYVDFQDAVFDFEKMFKKGSQAKGARVTGDRKLSILEKAIAHNGACEALFRKRLTVAETVFAADELNAYLKALVDKEPSNIVYWQGYIESVQCSMSHCNTDAVLRLYNRCLSTLHQLRRNSVLEKNVLEENILRILYQCCLFLKQAGLWEQLWTLVRLYLELNLQPTESRGDDAAAASAATQTFNIGNACDDAQLQEYEDVVLKSELPLHELWLRVEKLRESCHWLPWTATEPCEDPQRMVFTEDVSDFIHPITSPGNAIKLIVTVTTLLKVPLLPCRHTTMQHFGLDYVPWAIDGVETLLSAFFPLYPVKLNTSDLFPDITKYTIGPQYLKTHPGQEEYLDFVTRTLRNCANYLHAGEQTAVLIMWFRFERLLVVLNAENRFKMPAARKKQLKADIKALLKCDAHRNNVLLYAEYALIEFELGNFDSAIKILLSALSFNKFSFVPQILDAVQRANTCYLFRVIVEAHLKTPAGHQNALSCLICLAQAKQIPANSSAEPITESATSEALLKFKMATNNLLAQQSLFAAARTPEQHFLPDFATDWIICNGWLVYLARGPIEAGAFVQNVVQHEHVVQCAARLEVLHEFYVAMLFKHCAECAGAGLHRVLDETLHGALRLFPSNAFLLSVATDLQAIGRCGIGASWKLTELLLHSGHALPVIFVTAMAMRRMAQAQQLCAMQENATVIVDANVRNRVRSLLRRITRQDMCTKRCGLIWRIYLRFLYTHCKLIDCRKAYYAAVEECPWLKALYIDAAVYVPAELAPIQDLIIEKQLRLHITPEELDILRS